MVFTTPPSIPPLPYGASSMFAARLAVQHPLSSPPPSSLHTLPEHTDTVSDPPEDLSLPDFMYDEQFRVQKSDKAHTFTCGLTGKSVKSADARARVDAIARALSKRTGWLPQQEETEWEKIACIYSINAVSGRLTGPVWSQRLPLAVRSPPPPPREADTPATVQIDYVSVAHAVHLLNGIVTPASAAYNQQELEYQLKATNATVLFTCGGPLLETALRAAKTVNLPRDRIFLVDTPLTGYKPVPGFVSVAQLIDQGRELAPLPRLKWLPGQGARQAAFICFSSGTSGLPVSESVPDGVGGDDIDQYNGPSCAAHNRL